MLKLDCFDLRPLSLFKQPQTLEAREIKSWDRNQTGRISEFNKVFAGKLLYPALLFEPPPEYPILARQSRVAEIVVIDAINLGHGTVKGMRIISGDPLLIQAALAAVSKRRYEPTVLDGGPTPAALRVEVNFSFS